MSARQRTEGNKPSRQNPENHQATLNDNAAVIYSHMLQSHTNDFKTDQLISKMKKQMPDPGLVIGRFPSIFDVSSRPGYVALKCPFPVCTQHWSSNGCLRGVDCPDFHICKYFIISKCGMDKCKFGHDLGAGQNGKILVASNVAGLVPEQLVKLIKASDAFKSEALPPVCTFYNSQGGCRKGEKNCPYMHICSRYLKFDTCRYDGDECRYSHEITNPQVVNILAKYNINITDKNCDSIIERLRKRFRLQENTGKVKDMQGQRSRMKSAPGVRQPMRVPPRPSLPTPQPTRVGATMTHALPNPQQAGEGATNELGQDLAPLTLRGRSSSAARKHPARPKEKGPVTEEICTFHLRKKCNFADKTCRFIHTDRPFRWEYQDKEGWMPFNSEANEQLEGSFCDPKLYETSVFLSSNGSRVTVNFAEMTYGGFGKGKVRRLSTASWGHAFKNRPFITQWLWYWEDEKGIWQMYEDSLEIEEGFCEGQETYGFTAGLFMYMLNYKAMEQQNLRTYTTREVRRRPKMVTQKTITKTDSEVELNIFPSEWKTASVGNEYEVNLVELDSGSDEYRAVAERFLETMPDPIKRITRIQNPELWEEYYNMKKKMLRKKTGPSTFSPSEYSAELREQILFHGTRQQYIQAIYGFRGFDFRNAGKSVGTLFGKGNYFAKDAKYSKSYTDCRRLFAVRVLVGDTILGNPEYTKPPAKNPANPYGDLYDCCVNNEQDPQIFVTFEFGQSYPAYLIDY